MKYLESHVARITVITVVFGLITLGITLAFKNHWETLKVADASRIDTLVVLPRAASVKCEQIVQKDGSYAKVRLVIDGMDSGIRAAGCTDTPPAVTFEFKHVQSANLTREADQAVWGRILGHPLETLHEPRLLHYGVQWVPDDRAAATNLVDGSPTLALRIFGWWAPIALMIVLYVWFLLCYLGATTNLLRDPGQRTYSLSRAQMAWWLAVIFASLVFLWIVTGETPSLSTQALALLGISGATGMAATGIAAGGPATPAPSSGFFIDILSDQNGVAIHRFQMLVVTITLGLMFLFGVACTLTMPEFDGSLLTLMGLSAGTYVALKIPEKRSDDPQAAEDPKSAYSPTA